MTHLNLTDNTKYGFNLNTPGDMKYPEVTYLTETGSKQLFTHIVSGRLLKLGMNKEFSEAGYDYAPVYHTKPVELTKTIKVMTPNGPEEKDVKYLNPRYMDIISYHFPNRYPQEVVSFVNKAKK